MDETMALTLQDELIADLTEELGAEPTFNAKALKQKVVNAIREVRKARKYPGYYTEEQIARDLHNFYSNVRNIALYDYNKMGGEFEQSHNENSVSRSFVDRNSLFSGVTPLCKL
jgi:hypothetical protein